MAQSASDEVNGIPVWEIALAIGSGTLSVLLIAYAIYLARCKRRPISATTDVETGSDASGSSASKPATKSTEKPKPATKSTEKPKPATTSAEKPKPAIKSAEKPKPATTSAKTPAPKSTPSVVRPVIAAQEETDSMIKGVTKRAVGAIGAVAKMTVGRRESAPGRVQRNAPAKPAKPVGSKSNVRVGRRI